MELAQQQQEQPTRKRSEQAVSPDPGAASAPVAKANAEGESELFIRLQLYGYSPTRATAQRAPSTAHLAAQMKRALMPWTRLAALRRPTDTLPARISVVSSSEVKNIKSSEV